MPLPELLELERLVEDGETLELVGTLGRIVREPRRVAAVEPTTEAVP